MGQHTHIAMSSQASLALMKFLSDLARQLGVAEHVYVVGGAVRNFVIQQPIKDIDVVIDSVALKGKDSEWFANQVARAIPAQTNIATNQYGVALLHVVGDWMLGDTNLKGEDIEIANARTESYGQGGYTPEEVAPATIHEDVHRREFTFNTLMWRLHDLAEGPDKAEILDLTGCGLRDLQEGVMRCPTSPDKTFNDDPSRMIRAIKFLVKYGFRISLEVERSIRKNKDKIKNIPHAHLSNMLINTFLREPTGKKALLEMQKLGLLDVIRDIAKTQKPFREALANWADREARVQFLFDLMDLDLPSGKRLNFLDAHQQQRVRDITVDMIHADAEKYLQVLTQPGKVLDTKALMLEFNLTGPAVRQIQEVARQALLDDPDLVSNTARLMARVRMGLKPEVRVGKTFELNVGDPVLSGKFLNKPGRIKDFGKNDKGDPTVIIEPEKGGQGKEVKLFKVRYDEKRSPQKDAADRLAEKFLVERLVRRYVLAESQPKLGPNTPLIDLPEAKVKYRMRADSRGVAMSVYYGRQNIGGMNAFLFPYPEREECGADVWKLLNQYPQVEDTSRPRWKPSDGEERTNIRALAVYKAFITDESKQGLGIGKAMYQAVMAEWFDRVGPFLFLPMKCRGGSGTSKAAERVWASLARMYPSSGEVIAVLRRPVLPTQMKVAARYKNKKTVKNQDGEDQVVYEYSEKQVQHRNNEKAKRVEKLRGNLHKLQAQVKKDLKSEDPHTRLCALAVGLMNDTYERVGNEESAKDGHFGVTGWQAKHVKVSDGSATFTYVGKSGVKQSKTTKDADLIRVLKEALKGKSGSDPIFEHDGGKVDSSAVNDYLEPFDITAKDIRGLHANREMQERLRAIRSKGGKLPTDKKKREQKLKDEFKEALEGAAEAVGHEPSTLKSQYLVPGLEDTYLKDGTVLDKLHEKKATIEEVMVRRLAARFFACPTWKQATKTPAQKEDKDVRQMLKPEPKKKPPREDLRRNRMRTQDKDLDGGGADGDKDLSLNYKKVGELARRWFRYVVAEGGDHKPGDVWQSEDKNWVAKNPDGNVHTFGKDDKAKAQAQAYAKGKEVPEEGDDSEKRDALGNLADVLEQGKGKEINKVTKDLLAKYPDLEDQLKPHLEAFDEANKELMKASIRAEGAKGKDKKEAEKAADEAIAKREEALKGIRELGQKAPSEDSDEESPDEEPTEDEGDQAPDEEEGKSEDTEEPSEDEAGGGDQPAEDQDESEDGDEPADEEEDQPPSEDKPKPKPPASKGTIRSQVKVDRARLEERFNEVIENLPKKTAEKVRALLGQSEGSDELQAAEKAVEDAQAELDRIEADIDQEKVQELRDKVFDAQMEGDTDAMKAAQRELDEIEKPPAWKAAQAKLTTATKAAQRIKRQEEKATTESKKKFLDEVAAALDSAEEAAITSLAGKGVTADMMSKASGDPFKGINWDDPAAVAKALVQKNLNDKVLLNPSYVGGKPLSSEPLDEDGLVGRAEAAFNQYRQGSAAARKAAAETAMQQLAELDPNSPQAKELNRIIDGLHLAMEMNGEQWDVQDSEGNLARLPLDSKLGLLAKQMVAQGDTRVLLADASNQKAVREAVRDALGRVSDEELSELTKDTAWEPLGDLLSGLGGIKLDPDVAELVRSLVRDLSLNNMTINQGLINAVAGEKAPASNPLDVFKDMAEKFGHSDDPDLKSGIKSFIECIQKAKSPEDCAEQADAIRQLHAKKMAERLDQMSEEMGVEPDPQNPAVAAVRHAAKTGDLSVFDDDLKPEKSFSEQKKDFLKGVSDPDERARIEKMTPEEFRAMQNSILQGEEEDLEGM